MSGSTYPGSSPAIELLVAHGASLALLNLLHDAMNTLDEEKCFEKVQTLEAGVDINTPAVYCEGYLLVSLW